MSAGGARRRIDQDIEGGLAALRRARLRAERIALASGTFLIEARDGKPVRVAPRPEVALGFSKAVGPVK
ncbi:MAG: hypothetical protein JWM82_3275 [Myxococcales bacterium]|nr:hypothetical protein [Myxococcales bacterium]